MLVLVLVLNSSRTLAQATWGKLVLVLLLNSSRTLAQARWMGRGVGRRAETERE